MSEDFFDGVNWNRAAVVTAQHAAVSRKASRFGLEVLPRNLLRDPLPESFVADFERIHRCNLPYEYRSFLLQVGDGGGGPGVLMRQLGAPFEDSNPWEQGEMYGGPLEPNIRLDEDFPYVDAVPEDPAFVATLDAHVFPEELIVDPADAGPLGFPGSLYLFDHGAALWDMLIITGPSRGQMWQIGALMVKGACRSCTTASELGLPRVTAPGSTAKTHKSSSALASDASSS